MTESHYMQRAIELAQKGGGWVNPNPQVGAVVVKDGRIVGEGYHARCGQAHAEIAALESCKEPPVGATLYVTLEPCCHTGKTPPCTEAIIASGITRVVVGSDDPNPLVAGGGVAALRRAGIEVVTAFMKEECDKLNRIFFYSVRTRTPYVLAKYAMTADGKIATRTGASKWSTGEAARRDVHRLRNRYAAIMVGINTVLSD
ncbi:MAG: bifunctional diaminohydroxyphosphoribosylaminopyrimidine deaminase/5-amino-6-(5-phosphoribosylamino)uracil reductase RibD, partial [Coriobacteriales bacterium]|nr:bifunctional diaminohydroxyphosphoribosylaminopyrimidine deaminase/5-amino-6-(5-phosphoribosylamino)uracil reductase RibD [Coriobacteriales bacterium]